MEDFKQFKDNVWKTRKARINSSERLKKSADFISFINVYYSVSMIIINLCDIYKEINNRSMVMLALSITITISLLFLDTKRYYERSEKLKKNYIDLQKLYYSINESNFDQKREEYFELLNQTENHSEIDFIRVNIMIKQASLGELFRYCFYCFKVFLLKLICILIPIIIYFLPI